MDGAQQEEEDDKDSADLDSLRTKMTRLPFGCRPVSANATERWFFLPLLEEETSFGNRAPNPVWAKRRGI